MSKFQPSCSAVDPLPGNVCSIENSVYGFQLTLWVGIVFSTIFGIEALLHLGLLAYHRHFPKFMWIAVLGATGETAGWIARAYSAPHIFDRNAYLAQIVCLILSPAFISAVNYVGFQNVMDSFGHTWSRIPRKWYVLGFVTGDICSLIVQAVGGALSAQAETDAQADTGKAVMIAGVSIQVAVTAPFMLLYIDYNFRRLRQWAKDKTHKREQAHRKVETLNAVIGISTLFVLVRCIYRIVEMSDGWKGYLAVNEIYFDILDALMMTFAIGIFVPFHPGRLLPRHSLSTDTVYEDPEMNLEKPHRFVSDDSRPVTSSSAHDTLAAGRSGYSSPA